MAHTATSCPRVVARLLPRACRFYTQRADGVQAGGGAGQVAPRPAGVSEGPMPAAALTTGRSPQTQRRRGPRVATQQPHTMSRRRAGSTGPKTSRRAVTISLEVLHRFLSSFRVFLCLLEGVVSVMFQGQFAMQQQQQQAVHVRTPVPSVFVRPWRLAGGGWYLM